MSIRKQLVRILQESKIKPIRQSIYNDSVRKAFNDFVNLSKDEDYSVIGGIALGKYTLPRNTMDIDVIVKDDANADKLVDAVKSKFKKNRSHAIEHKATGVEIEILTPEFLKIDKTIIDDAIDTSEIDHDAKVVSLQYLLALKLNRAANSNDKKAYQDKYDILSLIENYGEIDLSNLDLSKKEIKLYKDLIAQSKMKDMI